MRVTVLSDGAWGTALALTLVGNGHETVLWGPFPEHIELMAKARMNTQYLPDIPLPAELVMEKDLPMAVA